MLDDWVPHHFDSIYHGESFEWILLKIDDLCQIRLPMGYQQERDIHPSIVITKFLVSNLFLFGYTCQLCLTTVCTPSLYLNWFLIVTDCRYVYTFLL